MALIAAVHFSRRARICVSATTSAVATCARPVWVRNQQQARGIRFGRAWFSFLDDEYHRATGRRTRRLRYRYAESISRKPSGNNSIHDCFNSNESPKPSGKEHPDHVRPGRNIEDVERGPLEHFLFGDTKSSEPYQYDYWQSPLQNIRNKLRSQLAQTAASGVVVEAAAHPQSIATLSHIDPVTSRRVCASTATDIPVRTSKAVHKHAEQEPVFYDGPPPEAELEQYRRVNLDPLPDWTCKDDTLKRTGSLEGISGHKVDWPSPMSAGLVNEHKYAAENPPKYDDLAKYKLVPEQSDVPAQAPRSKVEDMHNHYCTFQTRESTGDYVPTAKDSYTGEDSKLKSHDTVHSPETHQALDPRIHDLEKDANLAEAPHQPDGWHKARNAAAEVDGDQSSEELDQYKALRSHEPDGMYNNGSQAAGTGSTCDAEEFARYEAFKAHEPDGLYKAGAEAAEEPCRADDLRSYGAFRSHEPDGKYAESSVEYLDVEPDLGEHESNRDVAAWSTPENSKLEAQAKPTNYDKMLGSLMPSYVADRSGEVAERQGGLTEGTTTRVLTGNYVRDFPEDFTRSWGPDMFEATLEPESTAYRSLDTPIEPALDRHSKASQNPAGELGRHAVASQSAKTAPEPTLYKMLAYDPTMQTVNMAETTSMVPDSANPLPPAEVLLRLSNPTKFFPHFGPLQAQGFEIVSGSGDVLVFRKVRPAVAEEAATKETTMSPPDGSRTAAKPSATSSPAKLVNPIDMTGFEPLEYGSTAASRFASPTGFVNYDLPPARDPARFVSGLHVRREEDVFSGPKDARQQQRPGRAKKGLGRRLVLSAAWVGGVSYAVGVVSEYFKTGGADGKGPTGF